MRPLRIVMLVAGILVGFIALGLVVGGGVLLWASGTQRDAEGFYTFDARPFGAPGSAITSDNVDLGEQPGDWFPSGLATVRIQASSSKDLFLGIAPRGDVAGYLANVSHSVVTDIHGSSITYRQVAGEATPPPPAEQGFWAASASGPGEQTITWKVEGGDWVLVVMNVDGSPGVDVQLAAAVKTGLLLPVGIGILVFGLLVAGGAVTLIILSTRGKPRAAPQSTPTRPDLPPPSGAPPASGA